MPTPGATMSTKVGSSSEKSGTLPDRVSAPTPITWGSADGQLAYSHGVVGASSALPTAATTTAPFFTAYATAWASTLEYESSSGESGSRTAPKLRLTTLRSLVDRPSDPGSLGLERDRPIGGDDLRYE